MEVVTSFGPRGAQRLSTEDISNPTAGPVHEENPFITINGITVFSSSVLIIDGVAVVFIGTDMGEIRR